MALFATFITAPYRDGNGHGSRNYAMIAMAEDRSVAASRTMARLVETSPAGREYGARPQVASVEVAAWQLREAQQPSRGLYMVGIASSSPTPGIGDSWDVSARVVVAADADSARKSALAEFSRQSPSARVIDAMTVAASPDVVSKALQEWDRGRGYQQENKISGNSRSDQTSEGRRGKVASAAIDGYQKELSRGSNAREAHRRAMMSIASSVSPSARTEAQQVADKAIKTYAAKKIEMSPVDAKTAAVRDVSRSAGTQARGTEMNVEAYAGQIINSYNKSPKSGKQIVYSHAATAANTGKVSLSDATKIADQTLREYSALREQGSDHQTAREQATQAMVRRYGNRDRGPQQQDRQRDRGMSR